MADRNGNRVTQKQLYDELGAVEQRVSKKIDALIESVNKVTVDHAGQLSAVCERQTSNVARLDAQDIAVKHIHEDLDSLRFADRRVTYFSAGIASVIAGAAALLDHFLRR